MEIHDFPANDLQMVSSYLGVSENVVYPKNPMVLLIIIPMKNGYFIGNIPHFQTNPSIISYIYHYFLWENPL